MAYNCPFVFYDVFFIRHYKMLHYVLTDLTVAQILKTQVCLSQQCGAAVILAFLFWHRLRRKLDFDSGSFSTKALAPYRCKKCGADITFGRGVAPA